MDRIVTDADTAHFIDAVKIHPALWDCTHEDYNDKSAKKKAWDTVIETFDDEFERRSSTDKKTLAVAFQRKWKSLRDCFTREVAKQRKESETGHGHRKIYIYYDDLKFLETSVKSLKNADEDGDGTKDGTDFSVDEKDVENLDAPPAKRTRTTRRINYDETNDVSNTAPKINPPQKGKPDADPDRMFMLSLVSEMKRVPEHMKLEVKSAILSIFSNYRRIRENPQPNKSAYQTQSYGISNHVGQQIPKFGNGPEFNIPTYGSQSSQQFCIPPVRVNVPITIHYVPTSPSIPGPGLVPLQPEVTLNSQMSAASSNISNPPSECEYEDS